MDVILGAGSALVEGLLGFLAWLGIHPSLQDVVKAVILTVFVLGILMIVGDVYRGEIQNKVHRVLLAVAQRADLPRTTQQSVDVARRQLRRERDIVCHVHQSIVPLTLDGVHSNVLLYFRYRDCRGKLRTAPIENYRSKFHVRKIGIAQNNIIHPEFNHQYSPDEDDTLSAEESSASTIALAGSRVDYIFLGKIEPLMEKQRALYEELKSDTTKRFLAGIKLDQLREPHPLGVAVKFHFPINPHFLLYKHPDTNVRTTAWLTVLTSVFALFMQLIYAGGTQTASASDETPRAAIVRTIPPPH